MKPKNREVTIAFRVKPPERKYIEREAAERGQRLSEYIRAMVLPSGVAIDADGRINA
jgi:uncharacterized protein (DUF1778 family)